MFRFALAAVCGFTLWGACGPAAIDWRNHVSLRSAGRGHSAIEIAHVNPAQLKQGVVSRDLHYVTIALDSVFFRNLPGILTGATVVFGFEIQGVLEGGRSVKTLFEPIRSVGENAHLALDNLTVIQPFLYTGRNISITLYFQAVAESEAPSIIGKISGISSFIKKLNPLVPAAIDTVRSVFESIIGAFRPREMQWKYSFTLLPADSIHFEKPELLFLAGRHILVATPPSSAPAALRARVNPRVLTTRLRLRGNRLVWKSNEEEYTETPYIILNITRYRRYPNEDTELRKAVRQADALYETGAYERALGALANVGAAIADDRVITQLEKNLERALVDVRRTRIEQAIAQARGDSAAMLEHVGRRLKLIESIERDFAEILEPSETKHFEFQKSRLRRLLRTSQRANVRKSKRCGASALSEVFEIVAGHGDFRKQQIVLE